MTFATDDRFLPVGYSRHSSYLEREIDTMSDPGAIPPGRSGDDTVEAD